MQTQKISFNRHRFPPQFIAHVVWLYVRFNLSLCEVEELMLERGVAWRGVAWTFRMSIRLDQADFGLQQRSSLIGAFPVSMSLRMRATMATLAGFPASRSALYCALRSGLNLIATRAGM